MCASFYFTFFMKIPFLSGWTVPILFFCITFFNACTTKTDIDIEDEEKIEEPIALDESVSAVIPHLYINIADNKEVEQKDVYLTAEISIQGNDKFANVESLPTRIKGRGNSTWVLPKKPYRLKLDKAAAVLGLSPAKDWVLLANYNDYTFMANAVAMKIGKQLGMPFVNDIIPVDLTVNGVYRGSYTLTQQIEVHENRINVGEGGVLWEIDSYFDEPWKFKSTNFNLPVMLKSPSVESEIQFQKLRAEFQNLENMIANKSFPNNAYADLFDQQQFVNFLIVNMLVGNQEINYPKSTYIHKKAGGKFTMGPLWDFDFAFGFSEEHARTYFNYVDLHLFRDNDRREGSEFYKKIMKDPKVRTMFISTWKAYKNNKLEELLTYIEVYAATIRNSQKADFDKWKVGNNNHAKNKAEMKTFLRKRVISIDNYINKNL